MTPGEKIMFCLFSVVVVGTFAGMFIFSGPDEVEEWIPYETPEEFYQTPGPEFNESNQIPTLDFPDEPLAADLYISGGSDVDWVLSVAFESIAIPGPAGEITIDIGSGEVDIGGNDLPEAALAFWEAVAAAFPIARERICSGQ